MTSSLDFVLTPLGTQYMSQNNTKISWVNLWMCEAVNYGIDPGMLAINVWELLVSQKKKKKKTFGNCKWSNTLCPMVILFYFSFYFFPNKRNILLEELHWEVLAICAKYISNQCNIFLQYFNNWIYNFYMTIVKDIEKWEDYHLSIFRLASACAKGFSNSFSRV